MQNQKGVFGDLLQFYGERTHELITLLLNNEKFLQTVQRVIAGSAEFKGAVGRAVKSAMEQLPLPTHEDFEKLAESQNDLGQRLYDLDERLFSIEQKVDRLLDAVGSQGRSAKRSKGKED